MILSVPPDVVSTVLDDGAVLLNLATGQYYSLDVVGARMWTLLTEHGQVELAVQTMVAEYEVGEDEVRRDMLRLIEELAEQGLLKAEANASPKP